MNQQTCFRRLLVFASALDLRVEFGRENSFYTKKYPRYIGRHAVSSERIVVVECSPFAIARSTPDRVYGYVAGNLAHELGHYLVAPIGRRHRKDYGIPTKQRGKAVDRWKLDDDKATMVEIQLMKHFSFHNRAVRRLRGIDPQAVAWWYETGKKMVSDVLKSTRETRTKRMRAGARRSRARTKSARKTA